MPPKYVDDAQLRIAGAIKKFTKIVQQAQTRNINEADTRDIVKAMVAEILGFDPFFEVTGEFSIKGQYADFAVKTNDAIQFFIEVKSIDAKLDEKHLFQVIGYAANQGTEWAVLTNSNRWIVYRLFAGDEKRTEPVIDFSILEDSPKAIECDFLKFSKEGIRAGRLQTHYLNMQALHPKRVAQLLWSEPVLELVRKEIKKTSGLAVTTETVRDILVNQVVRGDLADEYKGNIKKSAVKVAPKKADKEDC